ncbi:pyridoxal phosphate-dependent transferase [Nitzschia inconspicua]|uniref:Pyridoxal phosphate-dependent transferase n=1 Tax=Nitzschia inconspicua TaxID=303405 RepID=A0A9K3PKF4_9STRA|nr:pyridoxal phosphate-dependent transferase [Nitzschia inconspicua]
MDDPIRTTEEQQKRRSSGHVRFAGRVPCGLEQPLVLKKNGVRHIRRLPSGEEQEVLSVGLACSESFSGPRLARLLQPGFDYERQTMEQLASGDYANPLSNHTSGGVTEALSDFIDALEPHLPWNNNENDQTLDDWCVSLQLEGASAVWAAIDMVLQQAILTTGNQERTMVAVGATSYHGPPSTSFGSKCPLWQKTYQVKYPVPVAGDLIDEASLIQQFEEFLDLHSERVGVILFEPQWGSSQAGFPWPKALLKLYIELARARGIKIVTDEIMCGLGRHGNGSLFVSKDYELNPDAITFGKAIGGGVYPISGAILKSGRRQLCQAGCTVMQSHTYAGSSVRALMTATEVLREIPNWLPSVQKLGQEMAHIFGYLAKISDGMLIAHGQGLMWGCLFTKEGAMKDESYRSRAIQSFRQHCEEALILPYIVPAGGFMVSPHFDVDVGTIYEMAEKLEKVTIATMDEMGWSPLSCEEAKTQDVAAAPMGLCASAMEEDPSLCQTYLHRTKSCTSCSSFVCPTIRMRFLN